ncbi:MAG: GNAT family N-acetyltransferase [Nanoarchaeota archaeon]|nr:GNAT family N-acetyltransferase [Nanoarchaeota archaeon]MBU0978113.1 GNAT family N-acetyltransferase [Nanoarchaeota archaeon]
MELSLRELNISDLDEFVEIFNEKDVAEQLIGFKFPLSIDEAKDKLQEIIDLNRKGDYYEFAIIANRKFVGTVCLEKPTEDKKTFTLGYAIGKKYWNRGIASMAVEKILNFGFNGLKLEKIVADNDDDNPASARVLEKNGFKFVKKVKKKKNNVLFWEKVNPEFE